MLSSNPFLWRSQMYRTMLLNVFFLFLLFQSQHSFAAENVEVIWTDSRPHIECARVYLRPVEERDLDTYIELFSSPVAMSQYANGPKDSEYVIKRFKKWLRRWELHRFSALAVVEKGSQEVVGHAILGHGDYVSKEHLHEGWSETAYILLPEYWNASYVNEEEGIGTKGFKGLGTEIVEGIMAYAKSLSEQGFLVPSDVTKEQREEVEGLVLEGKIEDCIFDDEGNILSVYLPFTHIRATCSRENMGSYRILERVFIEQYGGKKYPYSDKRDLFEVTLK